MRLFAGALLLFLLVIDSAQGQIDSIVLDGSTMEGADISSIAIDTDGVMTIISKNGDYKINKETSDGDVAINSFRIDNLTSAIIASTADTATLTWGTTNAASCTASTEPAGELNDWNASTEIGTLGPLQVSFANTGVYNLRLDCVGTNGSTASEMVTARVGAVSITNFSLSPSSAVAGEDVTLTFNWSSTNSDSCFGTWPAADDLAPTGTDSLTLLDVQAGAEYTLTCINVWDEAEDTVSITISNPIPSCDVNLTSGRVREWNDILGTWPGPTAAQRRTEIPPQGYYAVEFNTGSEQDSGAVTTFAASGTIGARLLSISETPGCFDVPDDCKTGGRVVGIGWDTTGTTSGCQLKPNTTYYWNITFTDGVDPLSTRCNGSLCETYLRVLNSD